MKKIDHYLLSRAINGGWDKSQKSGYEIEHKGIHCFVFDADGCWNVVEKYSSKNLVRGYSPRYKTRKAVIEEAKWLINKHPQEDIDAAIEDSLRFKERFEAMQINAITN